MKKINLFAIAVVVICTLSACGKKINYQGTLTEKNRFSFVKPDSWNQTVDTDERVFIKDDETEKVTFSIEAEEGKDYERQISYYNESTSPWEAYEDIQADGFTMKGFKKKNNEYYSFVAPLPDGKGQLIVFVGSLKTDDNPMSHEIVKEIISTIKMK